MTLCATCQGTPHGEITWRCPEEPTVLVSFGCRHEHLELDVPKCPQHADLVAPVQYCVSCYQHDGHLCVSHKFSEKGVQQDVDVV